MRILWFWNEIGHPNSCYWGKIVIFICKIDVESGRQKTHRIIKSWELHRESDE